MITRHPGLNRWQAALYAAADSNVFTLPDDINALRAALDRFELPTAPPNLNALRSQLVEDTVRALVAGKPVPDVGAALEKARKVSEQYARTVEILSMVRDDMAGRLLSTTEAAADEIVTDHLRPALAALLDELPPIVEAYRPVAGFDDLALLAAPRDAQQAALELDRIAGQYGTIRRAQMELQPDSACRFDRDGVFREYRNLVDLYGGVELYRGRARRVSLIPDDQRERLVWINDHADPWMPTTHERDEAWRDAFGDLARDAVA